LSGAIIAQKKLFAQKFFTRYDGGPINQLEYLMDDNLYIRVTSTDAVMISNHEDDLTWMSVVVNRARASVVMTPAQVKELIAALEQVIA
jgi:hypothetical protein